MTILGAGGRLAQLVTTSAPQHLAGIALGTPVDAVATACQTRGLQVLESHQRETARGRVDAIACTVPAAAAEISTEFGDFRQVEVLFCEARACVIKLVAYDSAVFTQAVAASQEAFGRPRSDQSVIPAQCEGVGLLDCIRAGRASRLLVWSWPSGPGRLGPMVRLSHQGGDRGEYVFLTASNRDGTLLF